MLIVVHYCTISLMGYCTVSRETLPQMVFLTMGGLALPHSWVFCLRRRTSAFLWIPWLRDWCHPSKASQTQIHLEKLKLKKICITFLKSDYLHPIYELSFFLWVEMKMNENVLSKMRKYFQKTEIGFCTRYGQWTLKGEISALPMNLH